MGDDCIVPFDEQWETGYRTGPFSIQDRYVTEDVPVGCHIYHELGKKYGVETPVIDSMITLGSVMTGKDFYKNGLTLDDLGIGQLDKLSESWKLCRSIVVKNEIVMHQTAGR